MTNLKLLFFTLFCLLTFVSYSQHNVKFITMLDSSAISEKSQKVILIENDTFIVLTTYKIFIENCNKLIKIKNRQADKDLKEAFLYDTTKSVYIGYRITQKYGIGGLDYQTAYLLENGKCLVYNKERKMLDKIITFEYYQNSCIGGFIFKSLDKYIVLLTDELMID